MEFGILKFEIRNLLKEWAIRQLAIGQNLEHKFHWQAKGKESKTVLVYLTWGLYSHKVRVVLANHMISACVFPRVNNCNKIDERRHKECEKNWQNAVEGLFLVNFNTFIRRTQLTLLHVIKLSLPVFG